MIPPDEDQSAYVAPTRDNLLVLYLPNREIINFKIQRLEALGYAAVSPANPYCWEGKSVTVEDPDGWRLVLFERSAF
jgi:hypothetical protein